MCVSFLHSPRELGTGKEGEQIGAERLVPGGAGAPAARAVRGGGSEAQLITMERGGAATPG